jgi:hypothetical protein
MLRLLIDLGFDIGTAAADLNETASLDPLLYHYLDGPVVICPTHTDGVLPSDSLT